MSVSNVRRSHKNAKIGVAPPLEEILQSVSDLEDAILNSCNSESICQTYRSKLCEILTTLLLSQPSELLVKHDIAAKLWTQCFYTRINQFRERMAKELRREERAAATARGSQRGPSPLQPESNSELVEKIFKVFLTESINMYGSLINKFKSSERCTLAMVKKDANIYEDPNFVILHGLYLRHGDLYRYTMNFQEAEKSYHQAIELLPGLGEPFNHLGVISQQKEQHFLSLYYYSRSLLASVEPFALSHKNLHRLFAENSQSKGRTYVLSAKDKIDKQNAKNMFLEEYVSLNTMFFSSIFNLHKPHSSSAESYIEEEFELIVNAIDTLLKNLYFLLKNQYLGDGILLKMIVINVFTTVYLDKCIRGNSTGVGQALKSMDREKIFCLPSMALNFAYRFGIVIIGQLRQRLQVSRKAKATLNELVEKQSSGARADVNNQGFRHLSSIQLFCDWLLYTDTAKNLANDGVQYVSEQAATIAYTEQDNFSSSVSLLWNDLKGINEYAAALDRGVFEMTYCDQKSAFKEHFSLRGFAPFTSFVSEESHKSWVHLKADHELQARFDHLFQFLKASCPRGELKHSTVRSEAEALNLNLKDENASSLADEGMPLSKIEDDDVDDVIVYQVPSSQPLQLPSTRVLAEVNAAQPYIDFGFAAPPPDSLPHEAPRRFGTNDIMAHTSFINDNPIETSISQKCGVFRPPPGFAPPDLRVPQSADSSHVNFFKMESFGPFEALPTPDKTFHANSELRTAGNFQTFSPSDERIGGSLISGFDSSLPLIFSNLQFQSEHSEPLNRNQLDLKWTNGSTLGWQKDYDVGASDVDMHATSSSVGQPFPVTGRQSSRLPAANSVMKPDLFFRFSSVPP